MEDKFDRITTISNEIFKKVRVDSLGEDFDEEFNHDHSCTVMSKDDIKIKQHSRPDHTYNIFKTFAELINIHRKSYKMVEEENYHEIYQKKLISEIKANSEKYDQVFNQLVF